MNEVGHPEGLSHQEAGGRTVSFDSDQVVRRGDRGIIDGPDISQGCISRWVGKQPPDLEFAVATLMPIGMVTLLSSQGGAGKTMLQQTVMTCIPAGLPFLGNQTTGGATAGMFCEDDEDVLHLRQHRICGGLGVDLEPLAGRVFAQSFLGMNALLWDNWKPTPFLSDLEAQLAEIRNLRLVCIDNAALVFAGNENDRIEVTQFISALSGVARRLRTAVLLSTHFSKTSDGSSLYAASGSTAWVNACRSVLVLTPGTSTEPPRLSLRKSNHAKPGQETELEWVNGVLRAKHETQFADAIRRRSAPEVFLEILDRMTKESRYVSHKSRAANYGPRIFVNTPEGRNFKKQTFEIAMEQLFKDRHIRNEEYGRPGDVRQRIVRA